MRGDTYRSIIAFVVIFSVILFSLTFTPAVDEWSGALTHLKSSASAVASSPPTVPETAAQPVDETKMIVPETSVINSPSESVPNEPLSPVKPVQTLNPSTKKIAYLSFDDGPSEEVTPIILDVLHDYQIKGTFFVIGYNAEKHPELLQRIVAEGHQIGNHSYSHNIKSIYQSSNILLKEIHSCDDMIAQATGLHPKIFRAPGGSRPFLKPAMAAKVEEDGYQYFDWNVCPGDAVTKGITADELVSITLQQASNKSRIIVLLHDAYTMHQTALALPRIIEGLKEQGFTFAVIDQSTVPIHF